MAMQSWWMIPLLLACFASQIHSSSNVIFYEPFDETPKTHWIVSEREDYKGIWELSFSEGHEDYGLLVSEKAKKYAIVKQLDEILNVKDRKIVLQFDVRLQNGLECGGAYLKYLQPQEAGWKLLEFDNDSPYSIMFGPDKCGSNDKVHFIFRHKNPKTGEFVEHHLKNPPSMLSDQLSHVYTAILRPNNELRILIDGEEMKKANFLSVKDFEPALVSQKTIPDPNDKKPDDWDERAKIPNPNAVKPDEWDEDEPMEIEDEEAVKPDGWLDDEFEEIDDPDATKPEDWDDEEDGEWEAAKVLNPKCQTAPGCGEWKRPKKRNPKYKGKWQPPLIDNPYYRGIWKPRDIPNPDYFKIDRPNFEPIAAIGIEIWTMQDGILFDNILITSDEDVADSYRLKTWKPKFEAEKERQKALEGPGFLSVALSFLQRKFFELMYKVADIPFLTTYHQKIVDFIKKAEEQPHIITSIVSSIVVIVLTIIVRLVLGGQKSEANVSGTKKRVTADIQSNQASRVKKEDGNEKEDAASEKSTKKDI